MKPQTKYGLCFPILFEIPLDVLSQWEKVNPPTTKTSTKKEEKETK